MKRVLVASVIALVGFFWPSALRAALSLEVRTPPPPTGFPCVPGVYPVDLVFHETGAPENERLYAYDIALEIVPPSGGGGITFVTGPNAAAPGADPAFDAGVPTVTVLQSTPTQLAFNVLGNGEVADVSEGETAARIFLTTRNVSPGLYRLVINPQVTVFASADALAIPVDLADSGTIMSLCPEPGMLSLLPLAGLLALRRRRIA